MQSIDVTCSDQRLDCRHSFDDPINPLPVSCPECGFPDLEHVPQPYALVKSRTKTSETSRKPKPKSSPFVAAYSVARPSKARSGSLNLRRVFNSSIRYGHADDRQRNELRANTVRPRWRAGGKDHCHAVGYAAGRLWQMDTAFAGPQGCGTRYCRFGELPNRTSHAQKNGMSTKRAIQYWVIPPETTAWHEDVNQTQRGVEWQMKIDDARTKLTSVYPKTKT